jgi:hypothetical protein
VIKEMRMEGQRVEGGKDRNMKMKQKTLEEGGGGRGGGRGGRDGGREGGTGRERERERGLCQPWVCEEVVVLVVRDNIR